MGLMKNELLQIEADVSAIIKHSQAFPFELNTTALIEQWSNSKEKFIKLFGGTVWRSPQKIKIVMTPEQQHKKFESFKKDLQENEIFEYYDEETSFEDFLSQNEEGFFENRVVKPYKNIPVGSKLLKSFKRFIPSEPIMRWTQDRASLYIQENKIEGYLYLSVDPRDFLTISENSSNLTSCHSLDGDYRAGNLNYMVDDVTIIAYLANDKKRFFCLPQDMIWYDKQWRMLIHTDLANNIYYNRQYPYQNSELLKEVSNSLTKLLKNGSDFNGPTAYGFRQIKTQFDEQLMVNHNYLYAGNIIDTLDVINVKDYHGYCDLISSPTYSPVVSVNLLHTTSYSIEDVFKIKIGEKAKCPCCGEEYIDRSDSLICETCRAVEDVDEDLFLKCNSCFHRIYDEEDIIWINDVPYCKKCYEFMVKNGEIEQEEK